MRKPLKKAVCVLATVALASTMVALPATAEEAYAAEKPHMKKIGVKFDLKKNKAVKVKTAWPGIDFRDVKVTVKNYKVKKAKKKGYKTATFTLVVTQNNVLTKKQQRATDIDAGVGTYWGAWFCSFVDYNTGKSLDGKNSLGVTVKYGESKKSGVKKYRLDFVILNAWKKLTKKVTVTYPANYKGLCFGVFGDNCGYSETAKDNAFGNGKAAFGSTSYYNWKVAYRHFSWYKDSNKNYSKWFNKKSKTNSHWMRVK